MIEVSTVVTIQTLTGNVGPLGNPPPNPAVDLLVLNYLNAPPHGFGVISVDVSVDGLPNGTVRVTMVAPDNVDQHALVQALR